VVLAIRQKQGKWLLNLKIEHILHGGDVMMLINTLKRRNQLEQIIQGLA